MKPIEQHPDTSAAQGLKHCNGCGVCCRIAPCLLVPRDVHRLSKHLDMSREQLAHKFLQIEGTPEGRFLVRLRGPCAFLDGNDCRIHAIKPKGGADYGCWKPNPQTYYWTPTALRIIGASFA